MVVTRVDGGVHGVPVSAREADTTRTINVHIVQTQAHVSLKQCSKDEYLYLLPGQSDVQSFPVKPNATVEVVLAQYWSSQGDTALTASILFKGVASTKSEVNVVDFKWSVLGY